MGMTEEQWREVATAHILDCHPDWLDVVESVEMDYDSDNIEEDAQKVYDLITSARVTVEWDD